MHIQEKRQSVETDWSVVKISKEFIISILKNIEEKHSNEWVVENPPAKKQ